MNMKISKNREYIETEWLPDWDFIVKHARRLLEDRNLDIEYVSDEMSENCIAQLEEISQAAGRYVLGEKP